MARGLRWILLTPELDPWAPSPRPEALSPEPYMPDALSPKLKPEALIPEP